jgi:iron complex transport system permease protein
MTVRAKSISRNTNRILGSRALLLPGVLLCILLLVACLLWSITLGAAEITPETVYDALLNFDETSFQHLIIQTVRLPRVLSGALVGAALAVAGAIMQGLTRNPLADSGILGINSGAAFAVVLAIHRCRSTPCLALSARGWRLRWCTSSARWGVGVRLRSN